MRTGLSWQFRVKIAVALIAGILGIMTCIWPDWLELLTGWDPDKHSGLAEWTIVAALFVTSATMSVAAVHEWRRAVAPASS